MPHVDLDLIIRRQNDGCYVADLHIRLSNHDPELAINIPIAIDRPALLATHLEPQQYGRLLRDMLFTPPLREAWAKAMGYFQGRSEARRLHLRLDPTADELHSLHWETLCAPDGVAPLVLNERVLFSRYLSSPDLADIQAPRRPELKALVVVADPTDLAAYQRVPIDVDGEVARARSALGDIPTVVLAHAIGGEHATLANIAARLRDGPHILYLVCHGALRDDAPYLWLEQEDGRSARVVGGDFVQAIASLLQRPLLIVLASCQSAGRSHAPGALTAVGPGLARAGVAAVLAMQDLISIRSVEHLMPRFFRELFRDGQIDRALAAARLDIRDRPDWWVPVLFLRLRDGRLWPEADQREVDRLPRLRALLHDHRGFMRDRLASFVGREHELSEIRDRIVELLPGGGYITITGQAGQGKSSVIARLVETYGADEVAHHFIPFRPGPDHQVGLLRDLMARLILKYDLLDFYITSESRQVLRDYFPRLLAEVAAKAGQEIIFIDGLDQLQEDPNGVRDLSFLPTNPPEGVVFVLGTRPNDTLKPLELLKPQYEYKLPDLSGSDFALLLALRGVTLDDALAGRFYTAMQANALYLDLVAKELAESGTIAPETIIERIADNPENLFSLTIDRLKRQPDLWRQAMKPIFGLLLAARNSLSLHAIRQLLGIDDETGREALQHLGGLVSADGTRRFYIYHLKLREFLQQDPQRPEKTYVFASDELCEWHRRLAQWCVDQRGMDLIWQDTPDALEQERRIYARRHYIGHLYFGHTWERLWEALDQGAYGQAKLRYDISSYNYGQDVDWGRQAAARSDLAFHEALALLPRLFRYSLLTCSLAGQTDIYPNGVFITLVLVGRGREAFGRAELLTDRTRKVRILHKIGEQFLRLSGHGQETLQTLVRAGELAARLEDENERLTQCRAIAESLALTGHMAEASQLLSTIGDPRTREEMQGQLEQLAEQRSADLDLRHEVRQLIQWRPNDDWQKIYRRTRLALRMALTIGDPASRAEALGDLVSALHACVEEHTDLRKTPPKDLLRQEDLLRHVALLDKLQQHVIQPAQLSPERGEVALADIIGGLKAITDIDERIMTLMNLLQILVRAGRADQAATLLDHPDVGFGVSQPGTGLPLLVNHVIQTLIGEGQLRRASRLLGRGAGAEFYAPAMQSTTQFLLATGEVRLAAVVAREMARLALTEDNRSTRLRIWLILAQLLTPTMAAPPAITSSLPSFDPQQYQEYVRAFTRLLEQDRPALTALSALEQAAQAALTDPNTVRAAELLRVVQAMMPLRHRPDVYQLLTRLAQTLLDTYHRLALDRLALDLDQVNVLCEFTRLLAQADLQPQAQALLNRTLQDAHTLREQRFEAIRRLAEAFAQIGQYARAVEVARSIDVIAVRITAFRAIAQELLQAGHEDQAIAIVQRVRDPSWRADILGEIAQTLAQLGRRERASAVLDAALAEVRAVEDVQPRVVATLGLADALIAAQRQEHASALLHNAMVVIRRLRNTQARSNSLRTVALMFARLEQNAAARAVAQTIETNRIRTETLEAIIRGLLSPQPAPEQVEEAHQAALTIPDARSRASMLADIARAWYALGRYDRVLPVITDGNEAASGGVDEPWQVEWLCSTAALLEFVGQPELASTSLTMATTRARTLTMPLRARALALVVEALARAGQAADAIATAREIYAISGGIERAADRVTLRQRLLAPLRQLGAQELARVLLDDMLADARTLKGWHRHILGELATELWRAGQTEAASQLFDEAIRAISSISITGSRVQHAERLVRAAGADGLTIWLDTLMNGMAGRGRAELLRAAAQVCAQAGRPLADALLEREAERARVLPDRQARAAALRATAQAFAASNNHPQARMLLEESWRAALTIGDARVRAGALRVIAHVLGQYDAAAEAHTVLAQARQAAQAIKNVTERGQMLAKIARVTLGIDKRSAPHVQAPAAWPGEPRDAGEWLPGEPLTEQWLQHVQQQWLQAETREAILQRLPLMHPLIQQRPELGVACIEAITWVDSFLQSAMGPQE